MQATYAIDKITFTRYCIVTQSTYVTMHKNNDLLNANRKLNKNHTNLVVCYAQQMEENRCYHN